MIKSIKEFDGDAKVIRKVCESVGHSYEIVSFRGIYHRFCNKCGELTKIQAVEEPNNSETE